jgi:putative oxidoreductase
MNSWSPNTQSAVATAGRVLLGALFLISGIQKLFAPAMIQGYIASVALPFPPVTYALTLVIEIGAGVLLLVGIQTRVAALVLAAFSVLAAVVFHRALGDPNQFAHFAKNVAIAGGLLHVAARGAGDFSLQRDRRDLSAAQQPSRAG